MACRTIASVRTTILLSITIMIVVLSTVEGKEWRWGTPSDERAPAGLTNDSDQQLHRLREGTKVKNVVGKFEVTGDRITFYPADGTDSLRTLENLTLERVARELTGIARQRQRQWRVAGLITEFQGNNYLLVERAVLKSAASG